MKVSSSINPAAGAETRRSFQNNTRTTKELRKASKAFEATFITQMLKSAGVGKPRESFGGGAGESAFSSFLVSAEADKIAAQGGFGLSEKIFQALRARQPDA